MQPPMMHIQRDERGEIIGLLQRRQTRATLANRLNLLGGDDII